LLEKELFQLFTAIQKISPNMSQRTTSLDFLQAVLLNEELPLSVRLRAAVEAAPYEHVKLSAIAVGRLTGEDFCITLGSCC
jgi:hypothetical protein